MTALQLPWKRMPPIDSARKDVLRGLLYPGHLYRKAPGPFAGDSIQLTRADIEWLLENLGYDEGGIQGPIDWDQEDQRTRMGLDLRGAVLNELDLSDLPLDGAQLQYAQLDNAHLERAKLRGAHLWGASLFHAYLAGVLLYEARAYAATLYRADLSSAYLVGARLCGANLSQSTLRGANLRSADLGPARLSDKWHSVKERTEREEELGEELGRLKELNQDVVDDNVKADLDAADVSGAFLDSSTVLDDARLGDKAGGICLVDIRFGGVGLGAVEWSDVELLGDEKKALSLRRPAKEDRADSRKERRNALRKACEPAIRANRQLSVALENQGLIDEAVRFRHHAKRLQRLVYGLDGKWVALPISALFSALTGDGYHVRNLLGWYLFTLLGFAEVYYFASRWIGGVPLDFWRAVYMSALAFHRLPFSSTPWFAPGYLAAIGIAESLFGVAIEAGLIAAFTFRLLGR